MKRGQVKKEHRFASITHCAAVGLAGAAFFSATYAEANNASYTWSGATGSDFATGSNWVGGTAPELNAIPPAAISDPMIGDFAIFSTNALTVANQPVLNANHGVRKLQFDGSGWTLGGSSTLYVSRSGGGVVTNNTTGTNTINANISVGTRDSAVPGFNIAGSATDGVLRLNGTIGRFADNSGGGAVVKTGGGTLELATTGGSVNGWRIEGGTIKVISGTGGFGTSNNVGLTAISGTLDLGGNSIGSGGITSNVGSLITSSAAATLTSTSAGSSTVAGKIGGSLNMVFANNGTDRTFTLSNATNDYTGTTSITSGTSLTLSGNAPSGSAGVLGNATSMVQLGSSGGPVSSTRNSRILVTGAFTVGREINVRGGGATITLGATDTATAGTSTFSGPINVGTGTLTAPALNLAAPLNHQVDFTGQFLEATGVSNTVLGAIRKIGAGTVRLTNANTYEGGTSVDAGTLLVDNTANSGTGTAAVTVLEVATLGGFGAISSSVLLTADGVDGDSIGARLLPTLATDALDIGGVLNVGTGAVLDLQEMDALNPSTTYTVVTYGSRVGNFAAENIINVPVTHQVSIQSTNIQLTPVPEPATFALCGIGLAGLLMRRRRA